MMRTMFEGWKRYGADRDARVRERFAGEASKLKFGYGAALWAMEKYLAKSNAKVSERIGDLLRQVERELGASPPIINRVAGPAMLWSARRDAMAYPAGKGGLWSREPSWTAGTGK